MKVAERTFTDSPAVREHVPLFIGLMGPAGSGKTYSALRLATGIRKVAGGEVFVIDTESRRALHYADTFQFRHVPFVEPFGSLDYLAAVKHCVRHGASVVVIDSMSHEHIGLGGYLMTQEDEVARMSGGDPAKAERVKMAGWIKPAKLRQQMITGLLQLNVNIIFCFRAKHKVKPEKGAGIVDMGMMPIAGDELLFEMTLNCLLLPRANGVPTWRSDQAGERLMMKCPRQFEPLFAQQKALDEQVGEAMAIWARGAQTAPTASAAPPAAAPAPAPIPMTPERKAELVAIGDAAAADGLDRLKAFWEGLKPGEKALVGGRTQLNLWKAAAEAAVITWDEEPSPATP